MDQLEPWHGDPGADPGRLRVSDDDRHRVAELLREAAGDGRIELTELDERLEATYAARTYAELVPITSDLPSHRTGLGEVGRPAPASPVLTSEPERHFAVMGSLDRRGIWTVPVHLSVTVLMGGAHLDLREAEFSAPEVVLTINAVMGGADIIVNPHTKVVLEGTGIMGGYSGPSGLVRAKLDDGSPTVRIRGVAVWAGVSVKRRRVR